VSSASGQRCAEAVLTLHQLADAAARHRIAELAAAAARVDGAQPFSEQTELALRTVRPGTTHLLRLDLDGAIVGYAQVAPGGATELAVHPEHRRHGHGRALLTAAADVARATDAGDLRVWSYAGHPAAAALAARSGLVAVRELWRMRCDLPLGPGVDPPGELPLPAGVVVRNFVPGLDEGAWLELNAAAFADHPEQGRLTAADLAAREAADWFDPAGFFLAELDGALIGFHWTKVHPGSATERAAGEIYVLGVDPTRHGGGLGGSLALIGLRHLAALGLPAAFLHVDAGNVAAVRVYRRLGFTVESVSVMYAAPPAG
jgi:mycothiol synthase